MNEKTSRQIIDEFLAEGPWAVVGASRDRDKYGNRVLRAYQQNGRQVFPVNPNADEVEGLTAYPDLASLPVPVKGISIITPPEITEKVIAEAARLGIRYAWAQPGAENERAIRLAAESGIDFVADGSCALVVLGFTD